MAGIGYAYQGEEKGTAKAMARDVRISTKEAYEAARNIRGMKLARAKRFLEEVLEHKHALPYRRYNMDVAHHPGTGPGRYPLNTITKMIKLLNEVEANAESKGMNTANLEIFHVAAQKAAPLRGSFKGSPQNHSMTHIEIVVREGKIENKRIPEKKARDSATKKTAQETAKKMPIKKEEKK